MKWILGCVVVCLAGCSSPETPKLGSDVGTSGDDMAASDDGTGGAEDIGGADLSAPDMATSDIGQDTGTVDDVGADMPGGDAGTDMMSGDMGADMTFAECVYGAGGSGVDGDGTLFCDQTVDCDDVEYVVDCLDDTCTCFTDGVEGDTISTDDGCSRHALRECGAPIPPVNPVCYESDISFGDGNDFCERSVTCNDLEYDFECNLPGGPCRSVADGVVTQVPNATDCSDYVMRLMDCGAPIQPDP